MNYRRILVPLDGSRLAECALPLASAIAQRSRAVVSLLQVVGQPPPRGDTGAVRSFAGARGTTRGADPSVGDTTSTRFDAALRYLEEVSEGMAPGKPSAGTVTVGDAATGILAFAENHEIQLIVVASHGRSGLVRSVLGSVTDQVMLRSKVPVLVVRADCAPEGAPGSAMCRSVLVPLDGSELSETAVKHASAIAELFQADLELLTVIPSASDDETRQAAAAYLRRVASTLESSPGRIGAEVATGEPRAAITARLETMLDPLVVMATRGASGLVRLVRGSVTDAVARSVPAPVIVVPPIGPLLGPAIH